ncbi:hypothetical protein C1H46_004940 [Malus baccata]|uniref:Uncharacterized protein n=1 Tax=Malus baccata TaxID=106549 RepID=A0A540NEH3_MALBA|nr:hypothetical protein C1H46_004940 [Malus baccata]
MEMGSLSGLPGLTTTPELTPPSEKINKIKKRFLVLWVEEIINKGKNGNEDTGAWHHMENKK